MTLLQLDEVLAAWNDRLAAIADNLLELQAEPAYQALSGVGGGATVQVIGVTAARVRPALAAIPTIYIHFGLLRSAIDRAVALRRGLPAMFGAEQKIAELQQILYGRSILLPATDIPLAQRTLLSGSREQESVTADELLQRMVRAFTQAKDAVFAVNRAWTDLAAELDRTETRMRRLGANAEADRMLAETRGRIQADPLGALEYLSAHVGPMIAQAEQKVAASEQVERTLRQAHAQWSALLQVHGESVAAARDCAQRFCEVFGEEPVPDEKLEALRVWLDRLEARRADGTPTALAVGLKNWCATADVYTRQSQAVCAGYRSARESRRELRGRLDALKAKARVYGLAEMTALAGAAHQAEALLAEEPTRLAHAAAAVQGYEQQLTGIARQGGVRR